MKKQNFLIFMVIFMVTATTLFLYSGLIVLIPNKNNTLILSVVSFIGYMAAFLYADLYTKNKKQRLTDEV